MKIKGNRLKIKGVIGGIFLEEFHVKIENVVAFTTLGKDIPLVKISGRLDGAEYSPEAFPGLIYRIAEPKAATLIFSSGKIVCTGAKSVDLAKNAMSRVVDDVRKAGVRLPEKFHTKVENIVASTQIDAKLNLEDISFNM